MAVALLRGTAAAGAGCRPANSYPMWWVVLLSLLTMALLPAAALAGPCTLRLGGQVVTARSHAIIVAGQATLSERRAAEELQRHLQLTTGEALPILTESGSSVPLVVGKHPLIGRLGLRIPYGRLGEDGIVMRTVGPALVLTGNRRGVLYAVYTFLEGLGVRWLTPDCTVLPPGRAIEVPSLDVTYVPPLATRAMDHRSAFDADWAARNRINSYGYAKEGSLDDAHGGEVTYPTPAYFWHTLRWLVPLDQYRESHPEYFSEIDGRRVTSGELETDYCMTNPEVVELATEGVRRVLREHPGSTMIGLSQSDHYDRYCRCARCRSLVEQEGSPSALVVYLVSKVAAALAEEFPQVRLTMLAYHWSQAPPRHTPPHRNVIVELCPINANQARPLDRDPAEYAARLRADLAGWAKLCRPGQVRLCLYTVNYAHVLLPHPNLSTIAPAIRLFTANGAGHFYDCGAYRTPGMELAGLRAYLVAKLAWDPSYDADRAIGEFVSGYYGPAAGPLREYIALLHRRAAATPKLYLTCYANPTDGHLDEKLLDEADRLFDEAERLAAGRPEILRRVQTARLSIRYARITLAAAGKVPPLPAADLDRFVADCERLRVTSVSDVAPETPAAWAKRVTAVRPGALP